MTAQAPDSLAVGHLNLAYLHAGEGPLALLLHGFPDTAHTWQRTLGFLAARGFAAVALFQRGYAPSAIPPDGDYAIRRLAEDALGAIAALGAERAIIVGHDWGASAGYAAAALAPARVAALVTLAIPPFAVFADSPAERAARPHNRDLAHGAASARLLLEADLAEVDRLYAAWSPHWQVPPAHVATVKTALRPEPRARAAVDYYRDPLPGTDAAAFSVALATPALIIHGADEPAVRRAMFREAQAAFSVPITCRDYDGVGHWPHLEAPDRFEADLGAFLARYREG